MKYLFIFFALTLLSPSVFSRTLKVTIDSIDKGKAGEPTLLLLSDGQVGYLDSSKKSAFTDLDRLANRKIPVTISLDNKNRVMVISEDHQSERLYSPEDEKESDWGGVKALNYTPTVLSSMAEATTIFRRMNPRYQRDSQCYNRAHIWSYEEYKRSGFNSMKLFIFFTRSYIRRYNFYWWFHAIPATYVGGTLTTLDYRYARGPLGVQTWSNIFVRSRRACPFIYKYSTYKNNQETQDCYIHPASMYFWQPYDLDRLERTGYSKQSFIQSQVNHAYWEAF